jgi:hypothetical protein
MDGASEIVIEEFLGAGLAIHACKDAGIGSAVEHPVGCRKVGKILFVADVPHPDVDAQDTQGIKIRLAPLADETVDTGYADTGKMLKKTTSDDGSGETADAGDYNMHRSRKV